MDTQQILIKTFVDRLGMFLEIVAQIKSPSQNAWNEFNAWKSMLSSTLVLACQVS